ncbi:MAG: retroviral-like aspartic protease family protein [Myxococcota bacterium]|nr:retroviral-like aspartic protease family protein [Myxococcota bacterium]
MAKLRWGWMWACVCLLSAGASTAEIYRWVDSSGKMHFTQDLASIPPLYRAAAKQRAENPKQDVPIQTYSPPAPSSRRDRRTARSMRGAKSGRVHTVRVERAGPSMRVNVRINNELDVPFIIDTGATDVVLPLWAAKKLSLPVEGPGVRTSPRQTANGVVQAPVVMLRSVQMGTARVENVAGLSLESMSYGLLGLGFFNHFNYNIDAARGVVTLTENSLAEEGVLRGGRGKGQWVSEFRSAHRLIEYAESQRDEVPFGRTRQRERWNVRVGEAKDRLRLLEAEADEARVPSTWRD